MNADEALEIIEQFVLSRQLDPIEVLILRQSWLGKGYIEMAEGSGYASNYFKEVGSQLWHHLSDVLGQRVTKKNLRLVLQQYRHNLNGLENTTTDTSYLISEATSTNNYYPNVDCSCLSIEVPINEIKFPSGSLPLNSPLYIKRPPVEENVITEIQKPGCVIRIKAPKGMGKKSLLNRIIAYTKIRNYQTVYLDFQEADNIIFTSLDKVLRWFCVNVSRQLNLESKIDDYWDEDIGSKVSCKIYFEAYLLQQINSPLVLALNEVNLIFEYPHIARDFLPMLRFWHEIAQQIEIWQKLRLVVVHTTENYITLKLNQSPFNVGLTIALPQFTLSQVQELARRYQLNWIDSSSPERLMAMVGGHPFLVNLALYYLHRGETTLEELLQFAPTQTGIYRNHLRHHLLILREQPELLATLQAIVTADRSIEVDVIAAYKLESMGVITLDGNQAKPSCNLYRLYFQ